MKYIVVILDGASGWPLEALDGKTTLEAARTPHLDALAREGEVGLAQTVPPGAEPSSAAACTSIIGYDPIADYVGRGAIEAASMGIRLADDEVALRMNLVSTADGIMASYSAGHITTTESRAIVAELASALDDDTFRLYPGVAYRHILVVKGHPELMDLEFTPPHDISDKPIAPHLPEGAGADLLLDYMARAKAVLGGIDVNVCRRESGQLAATDVWPFWPGVAPRGMVPFTERRGINAAMTSGVDLLNGLAVLAGIDRLSIAGVTDGSDTDYAAQADGALASLADHDLVVIHVESPDEEGHAGSVGGKVEAIEAIDREVIARVRRCSEEVRVLAMPDHPTPIELKTHVGEPVPFVLAGPGIAANGATRYCESAAAETGLLLDPGRLVLDRLLGS
jgi:2,3-bisphosphoglycerate-independent phosphoglycerate mutase